MHTFQALINCEHHSKCVQLSVWNVYKWNMLFIVTHMDDSLNLCDPLVALSIADTGMERRLIYWVPYMEFMINSILMHALLPMNNWKGGHCDPQHGLSSANCWLIYLTSIDTRLTLSSYHVEGKCPSWLNVNTYLRISSLVTSETSEALIRESCYHNQHITCLIDQVFSNTISITINQIRVGYWYYCHTSNIGHTLVGTTLVDHSNVVGASPVSAVPTTFSFST